MDNQRNTGFIQRFVKVIKSEKGDMLILSLLVTALFLTFSVGYLGLLVVEGDSTERIFQLNQALYAAESGAEEAIWEIKYNNSAFADWNTDNNPYVKTATLTDASDNVVGFYTVKVTDPKSTTPSVESTGSAMFKSKIISETRTIVVDLNVPSGGGYEYAAFAESTIEMASNACTDSFDSADGEYDADTNKNSNGDVATNATSDGAVDISSNAEVDGDAYAGEDGDPDTVIDARERDITGDTYDLDAPVTIDSVDASTLLLPERALDTFDDDGNHTISASGEYDNFEINGNTTVTISGTGVQIYVKNAFLMDSNSDLIIAVGPSVEIYVDGSIYLSSNTTINNNTKNPLALKIYGTDDLTDNGGDAGIRFHSNTEIYAVVHAKNSTVHMDSNAEVFGAVMANNIVMDSNTCIHYDEQLGTSGSGAGAQASVTFWHEK